MSGRSSRTTALRAPNARLALATELRWPAGSVLRVVSVVEPAVTYIGPPALAAPVLASEVEAQTTSFHQEGASQAVDGLRGDDRVVEAVVLRGRVATVLVDDAARLDADLVIAGSRGQGKWRAHPCDALRLAGEQSGPRVGEASSQRGDRGWPRLLGSWRVPGSRTRDSDSASRRSLPLATRTGPPRAARLS